VTGRGVAMTGLAALGLGIYEEGQVEDIAARALITGQIKVDSGMTRTGVFKQLREVITRNASLGGFDPREVGEAVLGSERQFAGLGFDKRMSVLNTMLPSAMQEARMKESGLKESSEALVGLAHMTGTYDTGKLPDLYRKFAYASQLTPKTLTEYTRALSYAMPSLVGGMGMDPDAVMFLTAMNQSAGRGSSKAGTWIQAFFSKLMPDIGVNLTRSKQAHNAALRDLGLLDEGGNVSWLVKGAGGTTDWLSSLMKLSPILGGKLAGMPDMQRMQVIDQIFGKQGGREAGLFNLPEFIAQFPALSGQLRMAKGGEDVLKELSEGSVAQQARNAWTDTKIVLMDIATVALPPITEGLKVLDTALKGLRLWTPPPEGTVPDGTIRNARPATWGEWWNSKVPWGNATPPADTGKVEKQSWNLFVDGDKIASVVTDRQARAMGGQLQGSAYFDPTMAAMPVDFAYARA
jgi:Phage-related minor tail protein